MSDIEDSLALFTLPNDYRPGTDAMSKILLKDNRVMDIIIKSLLGAHVASSMYSLDRCEWPNKSVSDVVYFPKTENCEDLPPILVEIQNKVDKTFMCRAIKYCLALREEHQILPILLVISVKGFSSETFKSNLKITSNNYLTDVTCDFWAKRCCILSPESCQNFLNEDPLNELVALGYFFNQQRRCILSLDKKNDPIIRLLYEISKQKFENECQVGEEKLDIIKDLCFKAKSQFQKISDCIDNADSLDQIQQHAKDGIEFFCYQERKFNGQIRIPTTPITDTPDITNMNIPDNSQTTDHDFVFIENYKRSRQGRMIWKECFLAGKGQGLFTKYSNSTTLKSAFHNKKSKLRKRKNTEIGE